jgi:hypothetical protein
VKKVLLYFVFTLFCLINTQIASAIIIDIVPTSQNLQTGDAFDVDVVVSGLSAVNEIVSTYDFDISYDTSILSATAVSFGQYLDDLFVPGFSFQDAILTTPGIVDFAELSLLSDQELATQQPDSFLLASLSFQAVGVGISQLLFVSDPVGGIDVKGRNYSPLTVDVTGTQVTVSPAASVPEPNTFLLMLIALIALPLIKKNRVTERAL